jgi:hypothetical protein
MRTAILAALALTVAAGAPALAQTSYRAANDGGPTFSAPASDAHAQGGHAAYAAAPVQSPTYNMPGVYSYGRYAGWDPDPSIRLELMRDPNGGASQ